MLSTSPGKKKGPNRAFPMALLWSRAVDPQQVAREAPPRYGEPGNSAIRPSNFGPSNKDCFDRRQHRAIGWKHIAGPNFLFDARYLFIAIVSIAFECEILATRFFFPGQSRLTELVQLYRL